MAGETISEIHCCRLQVKELTICLASTRKGALRVGLFLKTTPDWVLSLSAVFKQANIYNDPQWNWPLRRRIEAVLSNQAISEDLSCDFTTTPFMGAALNAVKLIPFGETKTYQDVGALIGRSKSARAVGRALGKNPLPLVFP
jgi:O6-methylguanine-DNA--protein-cysteine methyltransferase